VDKIFPPTHTAWPAGLHRQETKMPGMFPAAILQFWPAAGKTLINWAGPHSTGQIFNFPDGGEFLSGIFLMDCGNFSNKKPVRKIVQALQKRSG
jgi:hypothetical protein